MMEGVENQFHAGGDAHLFEDPEEIFLDRVFAQTEFRCDGSIGQAIRDQSNYLFLPLTEQVVPAGVQHAQGRNVGEFIQEISQLLGIRPDLALVHPANASAQFAQMTFAIAENASRTAPEDVHHQVSIGAMLLDGGTGWLDDVKLNVVEP